MAGRKPAPPLIVNTFVVIVIREPDPRQELLCYSFSPPPPPPPPPRGPMDWLNWILAGIVVAIGGFGAWYVRLRLNFIAARLAELRAEIKDEIIAARKQTEETLRLQAEAAKQAAETLINADRSWVVITAIYAAPLAATVSAGAMNNAFRFAIANRGKSVAKIIEIRGESMIVDRDSIVPGISALRYAHYCQGGVAHATVLVPGESFENISIDIDQAIDERKLRDIRSGKQRLYSTA